ncbi:MAG: VCBS repeat-containing protein [Chloroflexota bacterium]
MISTLRASRFVVFAVVLAVLALGLAASKGATHLASADDAQPQGVFPYERWDWNNDLCSDFFDIGPGGYVKIHLGSCTASSDLLGNAQDMGVGGIDQYILVGDWNKDGCKDMIWVIRGNFYLGKGDCGTSFKDIDTDPPFMDVAAPYNYFIGVGDWNGDFNPDLLARRTDDNTLVFLAGNGSMGLAAPVQIGTGWNAADIIVGAGDWNGDSYTDIIARWWTDNTLRLYAGNGDLSDNGGFSDVYPPPIINANIADADIIVGGGDWYPVAGQHCPDLMTWNAGNPSGLSYVPGNCSEQPFVGGGAQSNADPYLGPFAADNSSRHIWGDGDCSYSVVPRDGQVGLKFILGLTFSLNDPCPVAGAIVTVNSVTRVWGDWDCNGSVTPRDTQAVQKILLEATPLSESEGCPAIGALVGMFPHVTDQR